MRIRLPAMLIEEDVIKKMRLEKAQTGKYLHAIVEEALRARYRVENNEKDTPSLP